MKKNVKFAKYSLFLSNIARFSYWDDSVEYIGCGYAAITMLTIKAVHFYYWKDSLQKVRDRFGQGYSHLRFCTRIKLCSFTRIHLLIGLRWGDGQSFRADHHKRMVIVNIFRQFSSQFSRNIIENFSIET